MMMLLTLRGSVFLYEGDEIGMDDTSLTKEQLNDPVSITYYPAYTREFLRNSIAATLAASAR